MLLEAERRLRAVHCRSEGPGRARPFSRQTRPGGWNVPVVIGCQARAYRPFISPALTGDSLAEEGVY